MRKLWFVYVAVIGLLATACSGPMDPNDSMDPMDPMMFEQVHKAPALKN